MRRWFLVLMLGCGNPPAPAEVPGPEACVAELVTELSGDVYGGRGIGTEGLDRAATFLQERFRAMGLRDPVDGHGQAFEAITGVALGEGNALDDGGPLTIGTDVQPFGFSSDGPFEGEVVFAGYGIRAPDLDYDDYAGIDVAGKVVLAMRYEPGEDDASSRFDGRRPTHWSDLRRKALTARELGAAALVLVSPAKDAEEPDRLPGLTSGGPVSRAGLPVLQVTRAVAERWLGGPLAELRQAIDVSTTPASRGLTRTVRGQVSLETTRAQVRNVVGEIPGTGALADQVVVLGAHYDHLGMGGQGSMSPGEVAIHNGADDNASGVAAVICAAEALQRAQRIGNRRTVVVALFSAEEIGLGGSAYYVRHPVRPLEDTVAMINLDMVGTLDDGSLQALGTDSATEWAPLVRGAAAAMSIEVTMGGDGYGPSDQTSFYERGIPVVHFFTGAHDRYHTPEDDAEHVDIVGTARIGHMVAGIVDALLTRPTGLTFQRTSGGPVMGGDSRGYGAYLGTIPDYGSMAETEGGVLLSDVRHGGPADRAGLRGGDRIVGIGGMEVQNLYDMTFALRDHKPGETVEVIVIREDARLTLLATLGDRSKLTRESEAHGGPHGASSGTPMCEPVEEHPGGTWAHTPGVGWEPGAGTPVPELIATGERHLAQLRQLTFGGENAEAYWSPSGRQLIFQRTPPEGGCDQQFVLDLDTGETTRVSSGKGRTTCGYYTWPEAELIYATTEGGSPTCPALPDRSQGYVWPLYDSYDLVRHPVGGEPEVFASDPDAYDAEATVSMADGRIVFTSTRDGDLDLYVLAPGEDQPCRLTDTPGYDGGAFFTPDGSWIVFRASRPRGEALTEYQRLLGEGLVRPGALEIYRIRPDGTGLAQLTDNGAANFGPYPLHDKSAVIYSSNAAEAVREFDLYLVPWDGGESERVTHAAGFDGFPMFSPDGRWLVFASNRANPEGRETNLFLARWQP